MADAIKTGCIVEIRQKVLKIKGIEKKLLKCKYWTHIERATITSWLKGYLENYKMKG